MGNFSSVSSLEKSLGYVYIYIYRYISADPSRMLGERAGEECSGDRGRQAGRQTDRQKRDRETALCLELALAAGCCIFLDFSIGPESHVRHWQGVTQVTIRHGNIMYHI